MSVQSNITRIEGGKASLKTSINNKLNSTQQKITNEHIEDYHLFVDQISGGGGVGTLEIYENGVYDVSDYANVYVKITELVPCTSISFNKSESTILPDETDTIIATYTPTETTDAIVWNSDNVTVATVTRVAGTDSAVITYVGAGTCHITATCGSFSVSCTVTCDSGEIHCTSITLDQHTLTLDEPVQEKPCTAITLDKSTVSVGTGETVTVTATLTPSDTTDTLTVTSSDTTKATVTLSGNVATITGVASGSSNITFTCGDISEVCVCTVNGIVPYTKFDAIIEEVNMTLNDIIDQTYWYSSPSTASDVINASQTDSSVATITRNSINDFSITPNALGTTTITYSPQTTSTLTTTSKINVVNIINDMDMLGAYRYHVWMIGSTGRMGYQRVSKMKGYVFKVTPGDSYTVTYSKSDNTHSLHIYSCDYMVYRTGAAGGGGPVTNNTVLAEESAPVTVLSHTVTIPAGQPYLFVSFIDSADVTLTKN